MLAAAGIALVLSAVAACGSAPERAEARSDTTASTRRAGASPATLAAAADTQRVVLSVKGMYCQSCERTVTAMLRRTPGVLRADVSVDRGEATVVYDSGRTSPAKLVDVVKTLGYEASVKRT